MKKMWRYLEAGFKKSNLISIKGKLKVFANVGLRIICFGKSCPEFLKERRIKLALKINFIRISCKVWKEFVWSELIMERKQNRRTFWSLNLSAFRALLSRSLAVWTLTYNLTYFHLKNSQFIPLIPVFIRHSTAARLSFKAAGMLCLHLSNSFQWIGIAKLGQPHWLKSYIFNIEGTTWQSFCNTKHTTQRDKGKNKFRGKGQTFDLSAGFTLVLSKERGRGGEGVVTPLVVVPSRNIRPWFSSVPSSSQRKIRN